MHGMCGWTVQRAINYGMCGLRCWIVYEYTEWQQCHYVHGMCGGTVQRTVNHGVCGLRGVYVRHIRIDELYLMQCWIVHRHAVEHGGHVMHGMYSGSVQCDVDVSMCVVCGWVTD